MEIEITNIVDVCIGIKCTREKKSAGEWVGVCGCVCLCVRLACMYVWVCVCVVCGIKIR